MNTAFGCAKPFGGSAAVLLGKQPSAIEVYNDANKELVSAFRVVRDSESCERLMELLNLTPYSREEFENPRDTGDDIERARKFIVRCVQSYGGIGRTWAFPKSANLRLRSNCLGKWRRTIDRLSSASERLKLVVIECDNWDAVVPQITEMIGRIIVGRETSSCRRAT